MYTYTTPTIPCTIKGVSNWDHVSFVRLAIKGQCTKLIREIPIADITVTELEDHTFVGEFTVELSQEETAQLKSGILGMQARIKYDDDSVLPTNIVNKRLDDVIDKVVI